MSENMLDKWRSTQSDRQTLADFWEWLTDHNDGTVYVWDINVDKAIDEYHGIDRTQLDRERRALLEQQRRLNEVEA
jgi:hypothetical protein